MPDWTYVQSGVFLVELDVLFQRIYEEMFQERLKQKRTKEEKTA